MTSHHFLPFLAALSLAAMSIHAQTQAGAAPKFEVASIKRNTSDDFRSMRLQFYPSGRFVAKNLPLFIVVAAAYNVPFQSRRLSGGPDWTRSDRYDIEATAEKGVIEPGMPTKEREEKMRLMLQQLLADRFKMVVRRDSQEMPVYALVVAKNGPKLQKSQLQEKECAAEPDESTTCHHLGGGQGRGIHGKAVSISDIALFVGNWSDKPVVDRTGLDSLYDVDTEGWVPMRARPPAAPGAEPSAEDIAMADPARPTLFMIFDRLGLKMESQKAPVESFVVEHVEKPTEN